LSRDFYSLQDKHNLVQILKEGCRMMMNPIKLIVSAKFDGFTVNVGLIGLNFTTRSSC
jgi:hypothetical protein